MPRSFTTTVLAIAATALAVPSIAPAEPAGSTILISRLPGFGSMPPGTVNNSAVTANAVSDDGCRTAFTSEADGLSSADDDRFVNAYVRDECTNTLFFVSRATGASGAAANGSASAARISGDGTKVAFRATATNLDPADTDAGGDIFVRDIGADTTTLVSRATGVGGAKQNGTCEEPTLSDDGTKIAFACTATNLDPADTDTDGSIFVRDTTGATTTLASRATGVGGAAANDLCRRPAISGDGTDVVFEAFANNLSPADLDTTTDIIVRDLVGSTTTLVSRQDGPTGTKSNSASVFPDINQDGTRIAWIDLGLGDGTQVYVRDTGANTTTLMSRDTTGAIGGASSSGAPSIDDAGDTVAFESNVSMAPADTNTFSDIYVRDGSTTKVASTTSGEIGEADSFRPAVNGLGTFVSFRTDADNLSDQDANDFTNVLRRQLASTVPTLVSRPTGTGAFVGDGTSNSFLGSAPAQASADGRFVLFGSQSDTLSADDDNRFNNVFLRDTKTGATTLISRASGANGVAANGFSSPASISADGRKVAFTTSANNLLAGPDANGTQIDLFVRDVASGETEMANRASGADGAQSNVTVFSATLDADGSRIAFSTLSSNLIAVDGGSGVYVRDLATDETILASRENGPDGARASFGSAEMDISDDGNAVAFTSEDTDLGADGSDEQVFVRNLAAGTTEMASRASGAAGAVGVNGSDSPALDATGSRVVFSTFSDNLVGDDPDTTEDIVLRDLASDQTVLVSRADGAAGVKADTGSRDPDMSSDGTRVLFSSFATNLASGLSAPQLYLRDLTAATTALAARADGLSGAAADTGIGRLSPNGSCVVFSSLRSGLAAAYTGTLQQVYMRALDRECPDATAADTAITSGPDGTVTSAVVTVAFTATEAGSTFSCRLDDAAFAACASPFTSAALSNGPHTFEVRATDPFDNTDASPASRTFTVAVPDPPAPTPTPTLAAGRLTFAGSTSLRTDRRGVLKLRVRCAAGTSGCRGTLRLRARVRSGVRTATRVIASRTFTVASGRTVTLRVRLSSAARRALRKAGRLRATLQLVFTDVSGRRTTTLTLRPAAARG